MSCLATYQRGSCGSRMTSEDGAFRQMDAARHGASRRVDHHGFHRTLLTFGVEDFVSIVDEDANVSVFCEDQMGCFGCIQDHIGRIH